MTHRSSEELAKEAAQWSQGARPTEWADTPEALPRHAESVAISMRVPKRMLNILREFARREGVGYQVLMKLWLDERIRKEAAEVQRRASVMVIHKTQVMQKAVSFKPPASVHLNVVKDKHA